MLRPFFGARMPLLNHNFSGDGWGCSCKDGMRPNSKGLTLERKHPKKPRGSWCLAIGNCWLWLLLLLLLLLLLVIDSSRNSKLPIQMDPHHLSLLFQQLAMNDSLVVVIAMNKNGFEKKTKIESHVGLKNVPGHSRIQFGSIWFNNTLPFKKLHHFMRIQGNPRKIRPD